MNKIDMLKPISDIPESDIVSRMAAANELAENPAVVREIKKYGNVPVIYVPHKAALRQSQDPGLSTLIENAMTVKEVTNLLEKGKADYKDAKPKTIRMWERAAKRRIAELSK